MEIIDSASLYKDQRFFLNDECVDCGNMATISSFRQTARLGGSAAQPEE